MEATAKKDSVDYWFWVGILTVLTLIIVALVCWNVHNSNKLKVMVAQAPVIESVSAPGLPSFPVEKTIKRSDARLPTSGAMIPQTKSNHVCWVIVMDDINADAYSVTPNLRKPKFLKTFKKSGTGKGSGPGYIRFPDRDSNGRPNQETYVMLVTKDYNLPISKAITENGRDEWVVYVQKGNTAANLPTVYRIVD